MFLKKSVQNFDAPFPVRITPFSKLQIIFSKEYGVPEIQI